MRIAFKWIIALFLPLALPAAEPQPGSDAWLTNAAAVGPERFARAIVKTNGFANLKAEVVAGTLQVKCEPGEKFSQLKLIVSAEAPGHWPARDWRTHTMRQFGTSWAAEIPVDSLDVPQIYFVAAQEKEMLAVSPMRMVHPRALGMEAPSHFFWAFIEGFEQDLDGWRVEGGAPLTTDSLAKSGRTSLAIRVPPGRRAVSVETTRLRGWFLEEHGASGIGVWLRTRSGTGTVIFTLLGNARSTNQIVARTAETLKVSGKWTKAGFWFESFPKLRLGEVDLFSIEFAAESGTELLIDDLHLFGRWRDDF
jgi:hypothetical protein